jgi:hypothetical protein
MINIRLRNGEYAQIVKWEQRRRVRNFHCSGCRRFCDRQRVNLAVMCIAYNLRSQSTFQFCDTCRAKVDQGHLV